MSMYSYKQILLGEFPNQSTLRFQFNTQNDIKPTEFGEINGLNYVFIPSELESEIPDQLSEIEFSPVALTDSLKETLKKESSIGQLVNSNFNQKLRDRYSLDDEQFFSRIGIGVSLGIYTFKPNEEQALIDFGVFVESLRTEKRAEFSKIGL